MINFLKNIIRYKLPNLVFLYKRRKYSNFYFFDFLGDIITLSKDSNFSNRLSSVPVIFDVGACTGFSALNILNRIKNVKLHCFEPTQESVVALKKNLSKYKDVTINALALGKESKTCNFYTYGGQENLNRMYKNTSIHGGSKSDDNPAIENIEIVTLDQYCLNKKFDIIDILRIDVNGYDLEVLKGAKNMLEQKKIKYINLSFYTVHKDDNDMGSLSEINQELLGYGYRLGLFYNGFLHPKKKVGYYTATYLCNDIRG